MAPYRVCPTARVLSSTNCSDPSVKSRLFAAVGGPFIDLHVLPSDSITRPTPRTSLFIASVSAFRLMGAGDMMLSTSASTSLSIEEDCPANFNPSLLFRNVLTASINKVSALLGLPFGFIRASSTLNCSLPIASEKNSSGLLAP